MQLMLTQLNRISLPGGSIISMPVNSYQNQDGQEPGVSGIEPDVLVDLDWDNVTPKDVPVIDAAVDVLSEMH